MSSRIEQLIDEIEDYIAACRPQPFSNSKIIVEREEIEELLAELRSKTPEEIKRYQKIISNKEAIMNDARAKAEALINDATIHTNQLISEHEIMQQAYAQANEVVTMATKQAQDILNNATLEANGMRSAAVQYMDDMLAHVENVISSCLTTASGHYDNLLSSLGSYREIVQSNRNELRPVDVELEQPLAPSEESEELDVIS